MRKGKLKSFVTPRNQARIEDLSCNIDDTSTRNHTLFSLHNITIVTMESLISLMLRLISL
ncbi:unnamed protein product [Arabis nemorensis]|uniref:Uncharacterized protein n=1 Tax=Arabis nemorensis TaxID=586526 RepID=A0A565BJT9_9BRAS|nr:unnamed protein product [Arabis nemorensis]